MRAQQKDRLSAIRMILADIKRIEVDERIEPDDARILTVLDKIAKQRRDSISQFSAAGRDDLVTKEQADLEVVTEFLPQQMSEAEIAELIDNAIAQTGAATAADMGKIMAVVKPAAQGRTDMGAISKLIKARLG